MSSRKKTPNRSKIINKWFWRLFAGGLLFVVFIFLLASWGVFGKLPTFEILENPDTNLATEIIAADGKTLGKFYFNDNRTPVPYEELPPHLISALIATEDIRFYEHAGIDARGTFRALMFLGTRGGASTITQQLAKQLFTNNVSQNIVQRGLQKIKEWIIAIRLEKQYTKEEILTMYFNIYDFGYNADGIRSAARIYFNKEPASLNVEQSAMLVGMFKNSSLYNPKRRPELVLNRRNTVINQMYRYDFISKTERDSLAQLPLKINFTPETHREGIATYFREYLRDFMKNWIENNPKINSDGSQTKYNLYSDGLKIYTTLDSKMQQYAEASVNAHLANLQKEFFRQNEGNKTAPFRDIDKSERDRIIAQAMKRSERWRIMKSNGKSEDEIKKSFYEPVEMSIFTWQGEKDTIMKPVDSIVYYKHFLQAGLMSMEPQTGHIKAWVGGFNYKHFQYDHVRSGKRQVGSTFKPFVYAAAIDQLHLSPCDSYPDVQFCIEKEKYGNVEAWCPKNSDGKYSGEMLTLKNALANSVNSVTARLIDKIGPRPVINLVRNLGVTSDIPEVPSIALGTMDLSVYEMVAAYGTFANQGIYVEPVFVTRIEDKYGTVLQEFVPETRDVLSEDAAATVVSLLEGVTLSGSGQRLRGTWGVNRIDYKRAVTGYPYDFKNPIAGKTGTTQNQSDGWFMGMVPNLVTGVWVGAEDRAAHFPSITYGQGATMALPIWGMYMKSLYADSTLHVSQEAFVKPKDQAIRINCDTPESIQQVEEELEW
jgi:penicillin-binding protein 1A